MTVSSASPFTTITLTNIGGQSGWVSNNPCNFIIYPPSPTIVNCPKLYLGNRCYKNNGAQNTLFSVFNNTANGIDNVNCNLATINGVPCSATNVTIEPVTPLPVGCTFNTNGTIRIASGTIPFRTNNAFYYRFRSIANPNIYSQTYRADFEVSGRVGASNSVIYLQGGTTPQEKYIDSSVNILTESKLNPNTDGSCGVIPAVLGGSTNTNTVSFTETTSPPNPFYKIDTAGNVLFRAPTNAVNMPFIFENITLTYTMCMNNTGANTFCSNGSVLFKYYDITNRLATATNPLQKLIISPNPSHDGKYNLYLDEVLKMATIEVYSAMGQKVFEEQLVQLKEHELNLDKLPKGTYLLKLKTNEQTSTKTIVKL